MNRGKPFLAMAVLAAAVWAGVPADTSIAGPGPVQPIRLHPRNPHYFLFRGRALALVTSGEHYGAVMNTAFDFGRYLDTLQSDGLNLTRLFPGIYRELPGKSFGIQRNTMAPEEGKYLAPWARSGTPGYAGGGNKFDLSRWDEAYFQRLHAFLREASQRGIVVEISLFSSHYGEQQWKLSVLHPDNNVNGTEPPADWKQVHTLQNGNLLPVQERYVRKLVQAANEFDNVIFELQNEPWSDRPVLEGVQNPYLFLPAREQFPNSIERADDLSLAWQARVAEWIASEEAKLPNKHLIAQNYSNFGLPVKNVIAGVSLLNFHYAFPLAVSANYGLNKAIGYDESGFLGQSDDVYRRQAWNFLLSGGSSFDGLDYSFTAGHEDGADVAPNGPGGGSPTFRRQLGILSRLLRDFPLTEMKPDSNLVQRAGETYPHAMSSAAGRYAIYFDGNGPVEAVLALPAGTYSGEWINTMTGEVAGMERKVHRGGDFVLRSPEFKNGIALKLTRVAK
jgi:hypothetical protein